MPTLPLRSRALPLAALLVAATFAVVALESAVAQQERRGDGNGNQASSNDGGRTRGVGGTSWTLSDVWGEPKMPKPSFDYPGYNYPPGGYTLNGPPSQSPYPN